MSRVLLNKKKMKCQTHGNRKRALMKMVMNVDKTTNICLIIKYRIINIVTSNIIN